MTNYIDTVIADAVAQSDVADQPQVNAENKPIDDEAKVKPDAAADQDDGANEGDAERKQHEEFSKKARNAISYRDKKLGKYAAQLQERERQLAELRAKYEPQQPANNNTQANKGGQSDDGRPKVEDYESFADYQEALTEYKVEQKLAAREKQQQEKGESDSKQAAVSKYYNDRLEYAGQKEEEYKTSISDFAQVMDENEELITGMNPQILRLFLESEDAALASYHLAKEGKLEELESMTTGQAALAIAKAIAKGVPAQNTITKAPRPPLSPNKGTAPGVRRVEDMSADELLKSVR